MIKRVLVLVEGQTEERYVKDVLAPDFYEKNIYLFPTLFVTKKVKIGANFKGGVTNFAKFSGDLQRLLSGAGDAMVTTMIDYYGLPTDFPGLNTRPPHGEPIACVEHVEAAVAHQFGNPHNFLPFFALHEFEAWLFSSPDVLPSVMTEAQKAREFAEICASVATPEHINNHPAQAPSKRIQALFPAYRKPFHGPTAAARIGLNTMRSKCAHLNTWISQVENF